MRAGGELGEQGAGEKESWSRGDVVLECVVEDRVCVWWRIR